MVVIQISSEVDIYKARRIGRETAKKVGFDASSAVLFEIAISELASNIVKHAGSGTIRLEPVENGLVVVSEDKGRGITDIERALTAGKSTKGLGIGLAGVKRLMDQVEIESAENRGTRIIARKWKERPPHLIPHKQDNSVPVDGRMQYGVISIPILGSRVNGDGYVIREFDNKALICVIDGLGHGEKAYEVAQKAVDAIQQHWASGLPDIIESCHKALLRTRGGVIGLAKVNFETSELSYLGVGNIGIRVFGRNLVKPFSAPGIVGHHFKNLKVQRFPYCRGDTLTLYSDGVSDRFHSSWKELEREEVQDTAEAINRLFGKDHDDTTIIVAKEK